MIKLDNELLYLSLTTQHKIATQAGATEPAMSINAWLNFAFLNIKVQFQNEDDANRNQKTVKLQLFSTKII